VSDVDSDLDGSSDCNDPDDDNDGVADGDDSAPLNRFACRDSDGDSCDDCSSGTADPANDGVDTDRDGLCDTGDPTLDNGLILDVEEVSLYVRPSETVVIDMDVVNLSRPVDACQAVLNFSSTYFLTGSGDVNVAPGGGPWTELIYSIWQTSGDLDVAVGVSLETPGGTQADGWWRSTLSNRPVSRARRGWYSGRTATMSAPPSSATPVISRCTQRRSTVN